MKPDRKPYHGHREKRAITVVVITSDTGLCSTYKNIIIKSSREFADKFGKEKVNIIAVGKEAFSYFKNDGYSVENSYLGIRGKFSENIVSSITNELINTFINHAADEVYVAYTHFSPNLRHKPVVEKFLAMDYEHKSRKYYTLEPEKEIILEDLIIKYLMGKMSAAGQGNPLKLFIGSDDILIPDISALVSRNDPHVSMGTKIRVAFGADIVRRAAENCLGFG